MTPKFWSLRRNANGCSFHTMSARCRRTSALSGAPESRVPAYSIPHPAEPRCWDGNRRPPAHLAGIGSIGVGKLAGVVAAPRHRCRVEWVGALQPDTVEEAFTNGR